MIDWYHETYKSDQWDGFNEPGIEYFRGNPLLHLAREIIQNAIDAKDSGDNISVVFKLHTIDTNTIPNLTSLQNNIEACLKAAHSESPKSENFFQRAREILAHNKINILEISDYNTKGVRGPSKNGTPFYALTKASGQSRKDSDTAAGSYGIGKFAPFAVSELHTIYISTVYENENSGLEHLTQGKAILMSHNVGEETRSGTGFWGETDKCQPVQHFAELPSWLVRTTCQPVHENKGTKISVLAFDAVENWETLLKISVVNNFFAAISEEHLIVEVNDYLINATTIEDIFNDEIIRSILSEYEQELKQFNNASAYYRALNAKAPEHEFYIDIKTINALGDCELKILIDPNLPKKVCILRNGMFITDYLDGLKQFHNYKEFAAIFQCKDDIGNKLLREMEPPKHDSFVPNLLSKKQQLIGKKTLKAVSGWVREQLGIHAKEPVSDISHLDELKEFFGIEEGEDSKHDSKEIDPAGRFTLIEKPPIITMSTRPVAGSIKSHGGRKKYGTTKNNHKKTDGGTGTKSGGQDSQNANEILNIRAPITGNKTRRLSFTPVTSGKLFVSVSEAGADDDYEISIIKTDLGTLSREGVVIEVTQGEKVVLNIELSEEFDGALKVDAYEVL